MAEECELLGAELRSSLGPVRAWRSSWAAGVSASKDSEHSNHSGCFDPPGHCGHSGCWQRATSWLH